MSASGVTISLSLCRTVQPPPFGLVWLTVAKHRANGKQVTPTTPNWPCSKPCAVSEDSPGRTTSGGFHTKSLPFLREPSGPCSWWLRQATIYTGEWWRVLPSMARRQSCRPPQPHSSGSVRDRAWKGSRRKSPIVSSSHPPCHRRPGWCLDESSVAAHLCSAGEISV